MSEEGDREFWAGTSGSFVDTSVWGASLEEE